MLDPRRLLTFLQVAEHGSFSRAAETLSLTQSAVSQQVAALERGLGTRLFDRGQRGLRLTVPGEQLLEHARALADRLQLADTQVAELAARERRELRVGAFPSALATIVPAAITRLVARRPDLEISVEEGRLSDLEARVRDGRLHIALGFQDAGAPRHEPHALRRHDLLDEPMVALLPPRHRLARRTTLALGELAGDPWTAPSRDGLIYRACRAAGFEPRIGVLAADPLAIRAVVGAGLAVTLTPRLLASRLDGVHTAELRGDPPMRTVYALLPPTGTRPVDDEFLRELRAPHR
jgi:DNA-binding transcriptional LysR family regulator